MNTLSLRIITAAIVIFVTSFCFAQTTVNYQNETRNITSYVLVLPVNSTNMQNLAKELSSALYDYGLTNISIEFADHWHDFQTAIKNGKNGLYLAPPHFSAWAVNAHKFEPLLRIAEQLNYVIVSKRTQPEFFELNDLIGHHVCVTKPLNLDYLLSKQAFDNKLGSTNSVFVTDVSFEMLSKSENCDGFAVSNHIINRLISEGNNDYIRLYQGDSYNNYALIAHPSIETMQLQVIRQFFIQSSVQKILQPILNQFANNTKLISSRKEDYPVSYISDLINYWGTPESIHN